jgi:uncharacterized protein (DUF2267 family)
MSNEPFKPSFKNLDRDIERYLDKFGVWDRSGPTPMVRGYDAAVREVFDMYVKQNAYDAIVRYLLEARTYDHGLNDYFVEASDVLRRERQFNRMRKLWRGAIAAQKQHFWELLTYSKALNVSKSLADARNLVLSTMYQFRDILTGIDAADEIARLDADIAAIKEGRRPLANQKPDVRRMDEALFWQIIENARDAAANTAEQVAAITADLETLRTREIKKFHKLLLDRMDDAMNWDIWALAFVAQGGCSDDSFEAFRAWLILQGRDVFERALSDVKTVLNDVPAGLATAGEALMTAAPIAHEMRAGKVLKIASRSTPILTGEPWEESDLVRQYPELSAYYDDPDKSV